LIAYDESFARFGLGNLLFDHVVEQEFEARTVIDIDCMTDMHWHPTWEPPKSDDADFKTFPKQPLPLLTDLLPSRTMPAPNRVPWIQTLADCRARSRPAGEDA
jgi:hypothetical protein